MTLEAGPERGYVVWLVLGRGDAGRTDQISRRMGKLESAPALAIIVAGGARQSWDLHAGGGAERLVLILHAILRVSDGSRTRDRRDHNPELYQLSYAHRGATESTSGGATPSLAVSSPAAHRASVGVGGDLAGWSSLRALGVRF